MPTCAKLATNWLPKKGRKPNSVHFSPCPERGDRLPGQDREGLAPQGNGEDDAGGRGSKIRVNRLAPKSNFSRARGSAFGIPVVAGFGDGLVAAPSGVEARKFRWPGGAGVRGRRGGGKLFPGGRLDLGAGFH